MRNQARNDKQDQDVELTDVELAGVVGGVKGDNQDPPPK